MAVLTISERRSYVPFVLVFFLGALASLPRLMALDNGLDFASDEQAYQFVMRVIRDPLMFWSLGCAGLCAAIGWFSERRRFRVAPRAAILGLVFCVGVVVMMASAAGVVDFTIPSGSQGYYFADER